jgi:predicted RNA polymerase sigma factor
MESRVNDAPGGTQEIEDDRLRLIITCCHPALPPEGQVACSGGRRPVSVAPLEPRPSPE